MYAKTAIVAFFAGLAAAVHAPVGNPEGNPITRPLNEVVPGGIPFKITWTPTTPNPVSILLLRGPSTNVVPIGAPIAQGIANSGSFEWTPSTSLEADVTHYGIQLIDDVTGQYQYSTQFGISQKAGVSSAPASSATPAPPASSSAGGYGYGASSAASSSVVVSSVYSVSSAPAYTPAPVVNSTTVSTPAPTYVASTGYPAGNSSALQPTKSMSVPASLQTSASGTGASYTPPASTTGSAGPPESTGAAAQLRAGLGLAGAIGAMVFML